jgi:hypothetical protein
VGTIQKSIRKYNYSPSDSFQRHSRAGRVDREARAGFQVPCMPASSFVWRRRADDMRSGAEDVRRAGRLTGEKRLRRGKLPQ